MRVAPDVPGKEGSDPFAFVMRQRGAVDVGVEINRAVAEVERMGCCLLPTRVPTSLPQYIEYHKRVGVEHFYFYILCLGSSLGGGLPVLLPYILSGQVTVRRFDTGWTAAVQVERQTISPPPARSTTLVKQFSPTNSRAWPRRTACGGCGAQLNGRG